MSRSRITPESLTIRIHGSCSNLQLIELIYIILKHSRLFQSEYPFLETPSPKTSKIQTQTCLAFKTVRLELCPKPIQKPSNFSPQTEPVFPQNGACFSHTRSQFFPKTKPIFPKNQASFSQRPNQVFPKNGASLSQKRSLFFPNTETVFFSQTEPVFPKHGASFSLFARQLDMVLFCMWTCYTRICIWAPATWDRLSQVKTGLHVTHDMHWHAIFQVWCLLLPSLYLLLFGPLLDHLSHLPVFGMPSALLSRILL